MSDEKQKEKRSNQEGSNSGTALPLHLFSDFEKKR